MKSSRRMFLKETGLATAAVLLPVNAFSQGRLGAEDNPFDPANTSRSDGFSAETFEQWIGSRFRVSLNGEPMGSLLLAGVERIDAATAPKETPADWVGPRILPAAGVELSIFRIRFKCAAGMQLAQDTYLLDHDWLGKFPLLLAPGLQHSMVAGFSLISKKTAA